MEKVIAGVGIFQIESTHKMCTRCQNADLELQRNDYYANDCIGSEYRVVCSHMDACKNAYKRGMHENEDF